MTAVATDQPENQAAHLDHQVAVLIPCMDEEAAIGDMVSRLKQLLPTADIYVYDNNSTDKTAEVASAAGAIVRQETRQGKGFVVRRMFADIEADVYVMVDGDGTYDIDAAPTLIDRLVDDGLDMVNGAREAVIDEAFRPGHAAGNKVLTGIVRSLFGKGFSDLFSGYRVFSRRFVKSFPVMSRGFEIETELTIHALSLEMPVTEVKTDFRDRAAGSASKLRTYSDGTRILFTIVNLLRQERPLPLFGLVAGLFALAAVILALPLLPTFLETGLVPRLPTAILATGLMVLGFLSLACGLILDTVSYGRREAKRMQYLSLPSIHTVRQKAEKKD
ncbi:MAG: glycosyltransferase [Alphaproteobacteria bacterium]|nr:glycosyltransferase [Alphaproteobacteria bacterium SS10]